MKPIIKKSIKYSLLSGKSILNLIKRKQCKTLDITRFTIQVTEKCNGKCLSCNIHKIKNPVDIKPEIILASMLPMAHQIFKKVKVINITGGEPFLHPNLIEVCKSLLVLCPNATLGFVSNGLRPQKTLETMLQIKELIPKIHCAVSLDGFSEVDNIQRGNPKHSELAWKTYELLKENNMFAGFGSVVTPININTMIPFRIGLYKKGIGHSVMICNTSKQFYRKDEKENQSLQLNKEQQKLFEKICKLPPCKSNEYFYPIHIKKQKQVFPCFSGFNSFYLSAQGGIHPCISLQDCWGNIYKKPFIRIWESERAWMSRQNNIHGNCHCFTGCEIGSDFDANTLPVIKKGLHQLYKKGMKKIENVENKIKTYC